MKMIKKKLLILDADMYVFQAAWEFREQMNVLGSASAKKKLDSILTGIIERVEPDFYIGFLGKPGGKNFRYDIATIRPYKEARDKRKVEWIDYFRPILKKYMMEKWNFIGLNDIEADDAVSICFNQYKNEYDIIIAFEDKDLKQISYFANMDVKGFNPKTKRNFKITESQGQYNWFLQMLSGDGTDSINGVEGIGPVKAEKILNSIVDGTKEQYFDLVQDEYIKKYTEQAYLPIMLENACLLTMLTKPMFDYPKSIKFLEFKKSTTNNVNKILNI